MTLEDAQISVDEWIIKYGVKYFSPTTNLGILMEEVGELSRHITRQYGEQSYRNNVPENDIEAKQLVADEMADVLWVLLCLANQTGINLTTALKNNLDKKTNRDANRHLQNPKLL